MGICASTPSRSSCAMRSFFRSTKALHRSSGSSSRAKSSFHVPRTAFVEGTLPDLSVRVADLPRARRRARARVRLLWQWSLLVAMLLVLVGTVLGLAFAGSPERLPQGTQIAGVDVAGLTPGDARALLERRERERANVPVVFTADGRQWRARPAAVVLDTDWSAAVEAALDAYVRRFSRALDRQRVEPSLALQGLEPTIVQGRPGRVLDQEAAAQLIVRSLTGHSRAPVALPLRIDRPRLTAADLAGARAKLSTALSAPVELTSGPGGWHLSQRKIARLLVLPHDGERSLAIGGPAATRFFANLRRRV